VSKAKPDGYTILMGNIGTQSINPSLYKKLPYNPDSAFVPISLVAELPLVMVVNPQLAAQSAKDVIALGKAKPGELTYSTSGNGGSMHLAAALFENEAGLKLLHVPYKGGGPAIQDLIAGHINISFATVLETSGFIKGGRLRALAVTSNTRSPALPDVPTIAESALPGFNSISWIGLLAPSGTPQPVVDKISADVQAVLAAGDLREKLIAQGATPVGNTPEQFKAIIAEKNITID
jgi:tripartite-type tricarboxylate transporter receptor subunit TctC